MLDHPTLKIWYDYAVPADLIGSVHAGSVVWVPSRNRRARGWVVGFEDRSPEGLKPILSTAAPFAVLSRQQLLLAAAAAEYYLTDIRRFLRRMTPASIPKDASNVPREPTDRNGPPDLASGGLLLEYLLDELVSEGYEIGGLGEGPASRECRSAPAVLVVRHPPGLPPAPALARAHLRLSDSGNSAVIALGSSLTKDARSIREALASRHIFVDTAAPARKLASIWNEARRPGAIVAGDRAVTLHRMERLGGVTVVDEGSPSHREDRMPYYNARTIGLLRARIEGCPAILTAPWPSYDSRAAGTLSAHLPPAPTRQHFPAIEVVDRSKEIPEPGFISSPAARRIREVLERGGRVVLFVSKKGGYRSARCRDCWFVLDRKDADKCPRCGSTRLKPSSPGVAAIEAEAVRLFPGVTTAQLTKETGDFDPRASLVIATEAALWRLGGADLVVVVSLDSLVGLVSFDAWVRSMRILYDLAGLLVRRGASRMGSLLVQTFDPSHPVVDALVGGDDTRLVDADLQARESEWLPPFSRSILVESADDEGRELLEAFFEAIHRLREGGAPVSIAGPHDEGGLRRALILHDGTVTLWEEAMALRRAADARGVKVRVEVDPDASYRQL